MSFFDQSTGRKYTRSLAKFLKVHRTGQSVAYEVSELEEMVNAKAARCEKPERGIGDRLAIAQDYLGLTNSQIGRKLSVSREFVRQWLAFSSLSSGRFSSLAAVLDVPPLWLMHGDVDALPASSHIGVRVGKEALEWRETLYSMTQNWLTDTAPADVKEEQLLTMVEQHVHSQREFAQVARRAGGRWHIANGQMVFAPWRPTRRKRDRIMADNGSEPIVKVVNEELARNASVYSAWAAIRDQCQAMGLDDHDFPRRITPVHAGARHNNHQEKYGVDLNSMIEQALRNARKKQTS